MTRESKHKARCPAASRGRPKQSRRCSRGREYHFSRRAPYYVCLTTSPPLHSAPYEGLVCRRGRWCLQHIFVLFVACSVGTLDITRDMTRQYKGMQEELLNRINQLEGTIQVCARKPRRARRTRVKPTTLGVDIRRWRRRWWRPRRKKNYAMALFFVFWCRYLCLAFMQHNCSNCGKSGDPVRKYYPTHYTPVGAPRIP